MLEMINIDLRTDALAGRYIKIEVVDVIFAPNDGQLLSREGLNRYRAGDAIIIGSTGDQWSVSRSRFDQKYEPVAHQSHGADGKYGAKPIPVLAKQIPIAFRAARTAGGDMLGGDADDWLLQYAPGDFGVIAHARFQQVYRLAVHDI